ncbi:MAG TPA: hypothetical protein VF758_00045 [Candidatus Acidoferrum sp.]
MYDGQRWDEVVAATDAADASADALFYRGLALAHLERWPESENAFESGRTRYPRDARFSVELAGLAYRRKEFAPAKTLLRGALAQEPENQYANDLLASIYLLEGNTEAALKYWNQIGKPQLSDLIFEPRPHFKPILLDRAFLFSRGAVWKRSDFLATRAKLDALGVFPAQRFDLEPQTDGTFALDFSSAERRAWRDSRWGEALRLARGLPYQTVLGDFPNLDDAGLNWSLLFRWDDQKRRVASEVAAPLKDNPAWRYRIFFDARNENWNLSKTLVPAALLPAALNLEEASIGAEIESIPSGTWSWGSGPVFSYRRMRNVLNVPSAANVFFTGGSGLGYRAHVARSLIRFPERRFTLDSKGQAEAGSFFHRPLGRYFKAGGELSGRWLPRARGDDFETTVRLRAGRIFGDIPFDELYVLGFDRDTELWMRGHPGLARGQKGNAPLGRGYVLVNGEFDKVIYSVPFLAFRLGPFLDTGKTYDPSPYFGSRQWMWDTGVQLKIRVLGSFEFVLGYGKDLRTGNNSFFTTVLH